MDKSLTFPCFYFETFCRNLCVMENSSTCKVPEHIYVNCSHLSLRCTRLKSYLSIYLLIDWFIILSLKLTRRRGDWFLWTLKTQDDSVVLVVTLTLGPMFNSDAAESRATPAGFTKSVSRLAECHAGSNMFTMAQHWVKVFNQTFKSESTNRGRTKV